MVKRMLPSKHKIQEPRKYTNLKIKKQHVITTVFWIRFNCFLRLPEVIAKSLHACIHGRISRGVRGALGRWGAYRLAFPALPCDPSYTPLILLALRVNRPFRYNCNTKYIFFNICSETVGGVLGWLFNTHLKFWFHFNLDDLELLHYIDTSILCFKQIQLNNIPKVWLNLWIQFSINYSTYNWILILLKCCVIASICTQRQ